MSVERQYTYICDYCGKTAKKTEGGHIGASGWWELSQTILNEEGGLEDSKDYDLCSVRCVRLWGDIRDQPRRYAPVTSGGAQSAREAAPPAIERSEKHPPFGPGWAGLRARDRMERPLAATMEALERLPEDWDSQQGSSPDRGAIERARSWILRMYDDVCHIGKSWHEPSVFNTEDGRVAFEWWNGNKALTVYVSRYSVRYVQSWGPDIETQTQDCYADIPATRRQLWAWLVSQAEGGHA